MVYFFCNKNCPYLDLNIGVCTSPTINDNSRKLHYRNAGFIKICDKDINNRKEE